jgi:hypothetical protein
MCFLLLILWCCNTLYVIYSYYFCLCSSSPFFFFNLDPNVTVCYQILYIQSLFYLMLLPIFTVFCDISAPKYRFWECHCFIKPNLCFFLSFLHKCSLHIPTVMVKSFNSLFYVFMRYGSQSCTCLFIYCYRLLHTRYFSWKAKALVFWGKIINYNPIAVYYNSEATLQYTCSGYHYFTNKHH